MYRSARIYVAGHRGLVGSAIFRALEREGYTNVIGVTHDELNLCDARAVNGFFAANLPQYVFLVAGKVGGIYANSTYPADFLRDNLQIQTNVIDAAWRHGTTKLLFTGSSCIYPKHASQPITEQALLSGPLEPSNEWYAIAKIAGIKMCQAYRRQYGFDAIAAMPTNLYGPGDNFHRQNSHVLPALIRRFHEAKLNGEPAVTIWGTGTPRREFMHVDDLAAAVLFLMECYSSEDWINVGVGEDVSIGQLANTIAKVVGYTGDVRTDPTKPDGTPRKLLDVSRIHGLGWRAQIALEDGIRSTYAWFQNNERALRS